MKTYIGDKFYVRVKCKPYLPFVKVIKTNKGLVVIGDSCKRYKLGHYLNFKPSKSNIALFILT